MGVSPSCELCGGRCHETEDVHCSLFVRAAEGCAVLFMDGNGIATRDGRIGLGASVGGAAHALSCATPPNAAPYVQISGGLGNWAACFVLMETYHGQYPGFRICLPHQKRRRNSASVSCHPFVGTGSDKAAGLPLGVTLHCD